MSFGTPKPSGFNFTTPGATTASTGFSLPMTQQPLQQSGISFGSTPIATVQPQQQQQQSTGFGISQPTAPTNVVQPLSSMAFSAPASQAPSSGFSFGQPQTAAPAATTALSFGATTITPQTQAQPAASGFSFGQPAQPAATTTAAQSLSFGQPATTLSFGQPATTAAQSLSFGQPATALSFGQPASTTTTAATGLTLNPLTTATPSSALSFGQPTTQPPPVFGVQPQQSTGLLGSLSSQPLGATPIVTAPQVVGLGGIDMSATQPKAVEGKNDSTKVKENQVPKEILQTVDDFKVYVKAQKNLSSDIVRTTDRKLKSVNEDIQKLNCSVQEVSNNVDHNKLAIKLLRSDTSKVIQQDDMAHRTLETPSGLQFENIMPQIYFNELIQKYENDLLNLKHQVELTEKHLQTLANPQNFSAQDLKRGLQQIHESFIALAGRLQETHTKVEGQKEQYLNLRKFMLRDSTNVFEVQPDNRAVSGTKVQFGPNPFTSRMHSSNMNVSNQLGAGKQWNQQQTSNNTFFGMSQFNSSFKK